MTDGSKSQCQIGLRLDLTLHPHHAKTKVFLQILSEVSSLPSVIKTDVSE